MQNPEEYNVLHVGPEQLSPMDHSLVREARKGKIASRIAATTLGMAMLGIAAFSYSFHQSLKSSQAQINSLIDELGMLSESNFELHEQVTSQEAVLQSLEDDFTQLGETLIGEDESAAQNALASILEKLSKTDPAVELSDGTVAEASMDSTFDVLILGTNGAHTDTIMVASINQEKEKISLFSVPRDLYVNGRKINQYYTYYGVEQLQRMVEGVIGLEIDQYVQIDLAGFVEVVDIVGGIDIYVPEDIYDSMYPNGKGGYMTYSIEKGHHHLNGEEALMYARSRESTSDFSRAERQQAVVYALKSKIVQMDGIMDLSELTAIFQSGMEHTTTDIDLLDLVGYYFDYKDYDMNTGFVLTSGNYLYSLINESGAYILLPKAGNYDEIHQVIADLVN